MASTAFEVLEQDEGIFWTNNIIIARDVVKNFPRHPRYSDRGVVESPPTIQELSTVKEKFQLTACRIAGHALSSRRALIEYLQDAKLQETSTLVLDGTP
jgi:hypothetical protein